MSEQCTSEQYTSEQCPRRVETQVSTGPKLASSDMLLDHGRTIGLFVFCCCFVFFLASLCHKGGRAERGAYRVKGTEET